MTRPNPFKVLIAGGGPAAIEAVLTLRELAPSLDLEVLSPESDFVYRPLSVVEPFARPGLRRYPLAGLEQPDVTITQDSLMRVMPEDRQVVTKAGEEIDYDALLVAAGAQSRRVIPRVLNFGGPEEIERMHGLIQDVEGGYIRKVVFVAPAGATWTLPLYELALQTAERASDLCLDDVEVTIVSHETRPLEIFGEPASDTLELLLSEQGIAYVSGDAIPSVDRIVALPVPSGRRLAGLPADEGGFLPVDANCRVRGLASVWAAGDGVDFPIKQGGLATQQAEAAARSIAAALGSDVVDEPFEPVLRALLLVGRSGYYLRRRLDGKDRGQISRRPMWWPPTKIAGRRLAPFLDCIDTEVGGPQFERRVADSASLVRSPVTSPDMTGQGS